MTLHLKTFGRRLGYFVRTFWAPIGAGLIALILGIGNMYVTSDSDAENSVPKCSTTTRDALEPDSGVLFGVNPDWQNMTLTEYSDQLGHHPAVTVSFTDFPYDDVARQGLRQAVEQIRDESKIMLLTLEPYDGLQAITPDVVDSFAADLAEFNASGVPVIVRFAHEMNGSWYPWSQQPALYRETFTHIADAVHAAAPVSGMMWAPNYGGGYPFAGGKYSPPPGTPDFIALDTDDDGRLTMGDNSYAPFYPGDESVDWVGMSLYHWGARYPWGENEVPEPNKFADQLTGRYNGANGDDSALPDFYDVYGVQHGKPVAIPETAALYNPAATAGPGATTIKGSWWSQIFSPTIPERFPQLKMINWFEWQKFEPEVQAPIDWTTTADPAIRAEFTAALPDWLAFGPNEPCGPIATKG
ncbi:glycoside hydrolase family 26 protein [Williamsia muralis]|uniref:glycoside hydrolase family 26 protein n=1 Tax=Williamsia marianensis TaxID=85044 RepID=UPI000DE6C2F7|nr:glycosyl hydrolase [Williamsia marianensis]PVY29979.1 glycosyl hydrolase family 26 [Williamsia marianensis]